MSKSSMFFLNIGFPWIELLPFLFSCFVSELHLRCLRLKLSMVRYCIPNIVFTWGASCNTFCDAWTYTSLLIIHEKDNRNDKMWCNPAIQQLIQHYYTDSKHHEGILTYRSLIIHKKKDNWNDKMWCNSPNLCRIALILLIQHYYTEVNMMRAYWLMAH